MVRAMYGVLHKDIERSMDFMFMLILKETIDQLVMANSVRWHGHVLMREDYHILRRALYFEVERQKKKWRQKRTWKTQVEEENMNFSLRREDALCCTKLSVGVNLDADRLR